MSACLHPEDHSFGAAAMFGDYGAEAFLFGFSKESV